jgi:AcrR family transcriptional regulator
VTKGSGGVEVAESSSHSFKFMSGTTINRVDRAENRKAEIIAVAARLFAEEGYAATGVDEIGQALGVTGPALYRHFPNKQAILDEICMLSFSALLEEARRIVREGRDAATTLERLVEMRVAFAFGPYRHAFVIIQASDTSLSRDTARAADEMRDLYRAEWIRVLGQVRPDASTVELHVAWYAIHMLIGYSHGIGGTRDTEEHAAHLKRMALAALLA